MDTDEALPVLQNGDVSHEIISQRDSVKKLHDLVHEIEINNDLPPSPRKETNPFVPETNGTIAEDHTNNNDKYALENVGPVSEFEMDTDMDSEDSWLYESPKKMQTPGQNRSPDKWLKDDVSTPELMRVRGSLSAKLDVIAIEKRKGRNSMSGERRVSQEQHRRVSKHSRRDSAASLDWDYDEAHKKQRKYYKKHSNSLSNLTNDELSYDDDFIPQYASDPDLLNRSQPTNELVTLGKQSRSPRPAVNPDRPFSLDWSDDEEDLQPMQIDFNNASPHGAGKRTIQVAPNAAVMRRGASALSEPRQPNYEYDEFTVRPAGNVKPRGPVANVAQDEIDYRSSSPGSDDYDMHAPVVARGAKKAWEAPNKPTKIKFADEPIYLDEDYYNNNKTPTPRGSNNVAKSVQRRTPESSGGGRGLKAPGSTGLVKPRGSSGLAKSRSASDLPSKDDSLKVNLQAGNGAVVRRRGPTESSGGLPQPRRSLDPSIARVKGTTPQVRRSTGSIPSVKSDSSIAARPRRSGSPSSGMVRPRGQQISQSFQANSVD